MTQSNPKPLVIDIDDSLLRTDMLMESFLTALGKNAIETVKSAYQNIGDRALLKAEMARLSDLDVSRLPVNEAVLELARKAQSEGRRVVLASGSDQSLVNKLAERLDLAGDHFGSDSQTNLTGKAKGQRLVDEFGHGNFDYVGDANIDVNVWKDADLAYVVAPSNGQIEAIKGLGKEPLQIAGGWKPIDLFRALRPHQWIKNILLLMPMIAAQQISINGLLIILMGMIAFSFAASSIYIINDLLDLDSDRQHEKKFARPFAAGKVPIKIGVIASVVLGLIALLISFFIGWDMFGVVAVYMALSFGYSVYLKSLRWIDIWVLALLYSLRVLAGGVAVDAPASGWLVAFVFSVFMSLGCVKRMTELARAKTYAKLPGRAYRKRDRPDLLNMSILTALNGIIIFITYTYSATASLLYAGLWELRWVAIPLSVWMTRMITTGWAGTQNYDPIVFALRDRYSLLFSVIVVLGLFNAAAWI